MTTPRQSRANAANARRSTGPRTPAGKARSSRNATRHGLTAPPPWDRVCPWYRLVLDDPETVPDPVTRDPRLRAALALAEAEAQLERCVEAERAHLVNMYERAGDGAFFTPEDILAKAERDPCDYEALKILKEDLDDPEWTSTVRLLLDASPDRPPALHRTLRSLKRYRREAEARRRKALEAWIAVSGS